MMLDIINPATEEVICQIAEDDASRVDVVVQSARKAFELWRLASIPQRQLALRQIADLIRANADELAQLETANTGILLKDARDRYVVRTAANFDFFADYIGQTSGQLYEQHPAYVTTVRREAIGVAGLIAPWNLPLALGSMKIAAAIAFGNACVIKPSEIAPLAVIRLVELISGLLPQGLVGIVNGRGHVTGAALVDHPLIDLISFTGGTETGQKIAAAAGSRLVPVTMELGGKSANIIFDSAEFERALDAALVSIYANNGQQCLAGSRILVQDSIADRFISAFAERARNIRIGSPLDEQTQLGPVATAGQRNRMLALFEQAVAQGAKPIAGGQRASGQACGYFVEPLAVEAPSNDLGVCQDEIFGPFAVFIRFKDADEAFRLANDTAFGLASYVWTQDLALAMEAQERLEAGVVWINTPVVREMRAPFGGYKQSGIGAEGGAACEAFYSREKTITVPRRAHGLPIERLGL